MSGMRRARVAGLIPTSGDDGVKEITAIELTIRDV